MNTYGDEKRHSWHDFIDPGGPALISLKGDRGLDRR